MVILKRLALDTPALETNKKSGSVCSKAVVVQSTNLYVNTVITAIVPGVFDRVLEELVFWICLLRSAALHKKHICTYVCKLFLAPPFSITLMVFMRLQMTSQRV